MTYHPLFSLGEGLAGRMSPGGRERVLWIHGYALDSSSWSELWDLLPGWQHMGVDLPGHGHSLPLRPQEELPSLARRLAELAIKHEVRHVVGLGLGTLVVLQMAVEFPTAFATLTLGSPLTEPGTGGELFWERYRELVSMYRMAGHGDYLRGRLMVVEPSVFEGVAGRPRLWQRLWGIVGRHGFWDLPDAAGLRLGEHQQSEASLASIESSVLLVQGEREGVAARLRSERLSRTLRMCHCLQVPGAGAHSLLEAPEVMAPVLDELFASHAREQSDPKRVEGGT
jgi:pimeloyl-ACP methyl ester carboxylesterase